MSFGLSEMLLKQCNISYLRFWEREIMANFALKKQKWAMGKVFLLSSFWVRQGMAYGENNHLADR